MLSLSLLIAMVSLISGLSIYVTFQALSVRVTFLQSLMIAILSDMSLLMSFTPGGLGIREAIIVCSAQGLGISPEHGLLSAILNRAILFLVTFTLGPLSALLLTRAEGNEASE